MKERRFGITADTIKMTAMIAMLIDHTGFAIVENVFLYSAWQTGNQELSDKLALLDLLMRAVGRIAFPVFCFLLVEGFHHTRSVRKYAGRLAIFALLSELPFDLALFGRITAEHQNVYLTLLIGLVTIWAVREVNRRILYPRWLAVLLSAAVIALGTELGELLHTDYGASGVILIVAMYLLRKDRLLLCVLTPVIFLGSYGLGASGWQEFLSSILLETCCIFGFVLIYLHNGVRRTRTNKYAFYAFYPGHLMLLYLIEKLLSGILQTGPLPM